jgi:hypothetical protein
MDSKGWRVESRLFVLPKEGAAAEECEDAAAANDGALSYAVADGATEAFDARRWARRLAEGWVRASPAPVTPEEFRAWLAAQGASLHSEWGGAALPWYAEEKRRAGSFAAFVGVRFEPASPTSPASPASGVAGGAPGAGPRLPWRAVALGDSCLVQVRGGALVAALPVASAAGFSSSPPLAPSAESLREAALARAVFRGGEAAPGDAFFLLSDAAAAWLFEAHERGGARLAEFDSLAAASENEALAEFVRRERRGGRMRDDDVAFVRIKVVGASCGAARPAGARRPRRGPRKLL